MMVFLSRPPTSGCIPVDSTSCNQFYPSSTFPNNVTSNLASATASLNLYLPASNQLGCSPYAPIYFCLALIPPCSTDSGAPSNYQGPCESFCELIRSSCSSSGAEALDMGAECLISSCSRYNPGKDTELAIGLYKV